MKKTIFILLGLILMVCTNQKKISDTEMQAYENEIKEKVKASGIELVQMKLDIEKLNDELKSEYTKKISEFEIQLNKAEEDFNTFKGIENKEIWKVRKTELDSIFGYLQLKMDTTKINIKQFLEVQ